MQLWTAAYYGCGRHWVYSCDSGFITLPQQTVGQCNIGMSWWPKTFLRCTSTQRMQTVSEILKYPAPVSFHLFISTKNNIRFHLISFSLCWAEAIFWRLKVTNVMDVFCQLQKVLHHPPSSPSLFGEGGALRSATPSYKLVFYREQVVTICLCGGCLLPGTKLPWTTSLYAHQLSSSLGVRGWAVRETERERVIEQFFS